MMGEVGKWVRSENVCMRGSDRNRSVDTSDVGFL
jgi:hypothetical protein